MGGRNSVAVRRPRCNGKDVGSNPAATRNEKWTLGDPLHRRWPDDPTGSKWKTSHVKLN